MRLAVISPEGDDAREVPALGTMLGAGLRRYHVRKPGWNSARLEAWLVALPADWRPALVLHGHSALAARLGLAGSHERDDGEAAGGVSRSCHDLAGLRRCLPLYRSILFGPVFPSFSKAGRVPDPRLDWAELAAVLSARRPGDADVLALGGVSAGRLARCAELGFDGAAVLGFVWGSAGPAAAFLEIRDAARSLKAKRHAA